MNRTSFWLVTLFTVSALTVFSISPEPAKLFIVVFPLIVVFPVALNKRRKIIGISFIDALIAYVPVYGKEQLKALYLANK